MTTRDVERAGLRGALYLLALGGVLAVLVATWEPGSGPFSAPAAMLTVAVALAGLAASARA